MIRVPMWRRIQRLLGPDVAGDAEDELHHHIDMRTRELEAKGMDEESARAEALRRFGDVERVRREVVQIDRAVERRHRLVSAVVELRQDIRLAARGLLSNRGFAFGAVVTLSLGIGANLAVFSAVNSVVLLPLPYQDAERLVMLWEENIERDWSMQTVAASNMLDWRDRVEAFTDVAAYASFDDRMTLTGDGTAPRIVTAAEVTGNFFGVLGVVPEVGRVFRFEETWADSEPGAVLSYQAWQQSFGGNPDAIGRTMRLDGMDFRIVGVLPREFRYPGSGAEVWLNIGWERSAVADPSFRRAHWLRAIARVEPNTTLEQAAAELDAVASQLEAEYPETNRMMGAGLTPLHEFLVGDLGGTLLIVLAAVGLLLALACANVGNLVLVRSLERRRELAVRMALGAGRWRIVRQVFGESLLLSAIGTLIGLGLAWSMIVALDATGDWARLAGADGLRLDARFLGYLVAITVTSTLLFGTAPAFFAAHTRFDEALRVGGRQGGHSRSHRRVSNVLVVSEVALALLLVTGAALLVRSLQQLQGVDPGFDDRGVLTASVVLPEARYGNEGEIVEGFNELLRRAEAIAGIESVAAVRQLPATGASWSSDFAVEGRDPDDYGVEVLHREVTPGYFETLRVPLLRGRTITVADRAEATPVIVINQALADEYFGDEDPIGARIAFSRAPGPDSRWWTVVGVVGNERQGSPAEPVRAEIFAPVAQDVTRGMNLVVRSTAAPATLVAPLRRAIQEFDPELVLDDVRTMSEVTRAATARERFLALLFAIFGAVALALALVGVYGVMAQSIRARQKEIGIRLALGAQRRSVIALLTRYSLAIMLAGIVVGIVAGAVAVEGLAALLYGVAPRDPAIFAAAAALLLLVGVGTGVVPAIRAGRADPAATLREE